MIEWIKNWTEGIIIAVIISIIIEMLVPEGKNKKYVKVVSGIYILYTIINPFLDDNFSFLLINSYTTGVSPTSLNNILKLTFNGSKVETGEIGLPVEENNLILPCGIYGRVTKD